LVRIHVTFREQLIECEPTTWIPEEQVKFCEEFRATKNPICLSKWRNLRDQFSDEEKRHLSYLGSMLGRCNTPEEQELEDILDALEKAARTKAGRIEQPPREGGAD
jgi:hypothetical protein